MAESILLRILTPDRLLLEAEVEEMTAPGSVGEFGVLPNHVSFVSSLAVGEASYRHEGRKRYLAVGGGFAEVLDNVVTLLVPSAEFAEEIDEARALKERNEAEAALEKLSPEDAEFARSALRLALAEVRLQVASRSQAR